MYLVCICTWYVPGMYLVCTWYVPGMYRHHIYSSKGKDHSGKVANPANPARGQLNRENYVFPDPVRT